jgi:hypothetical protein
MAASACAICEHQFFFNLRASKQWVDCILAHRLVDHARPFFAERLLMDIGISAIAMATVSSINVSIYKTKIIIIFLFQLFDVSVESVD